MSMSGRVVSSTCTNGRTAVAGRADISRMAQGSSR
jgi:hypothetical protein